MNALASVFYVVAIPLSVLIGSVGIVNIIRWLRETDDRRYMRSLPARIAAYAPRQR